MGSDRTVDVVIPVFLGERTLPAVMAELEPLTRPATTPAGHPFTLRRVILVWDRGPDRSDRVIRELAAQHPWVEPVWLARNSGQHGAILAGVAATRAEWVVTMDEDGLHDPADIPALLDQALEGRAHVAYGVGTGEDPHGWLRRFSSWLAKVVYRRLLTTGATEFTSYRCVLGDLLRTVAATASHGVYLDVALSWVTDRVVRVPVSLRSGGRPRGGYTLRRLGDHFARLVLSSGPRPLGLLARFGLAVAVGGLGMVGWVIWQRMTDNVPVQGWTSLMAVLLLGSGALLVAVSVVAGYLAVALTTLLGRPLYTVVPDDAQVFRT